MIKIIFASDTNMGKVRTNNEDFHLPGSTKNGDIFIVCDGMGGHAAGEVASQLAAKSIFEFLNGDIFEDTISAIKDAVNYANQQVFNHTQNNPETHGMGTTLVMALVKDDDIYIAHVGDSRAYYVSDNKIYFLSKDHSLVQSLVDAGIITEQEASTDPRKNQINQAIGIEPDLKIDINIVHPKKGDQILLSTDGLTDLVEPLKVKEILDFSIPEKEKITLLIDAALKKGGKDNITAILLSVEDSPFTVAEFKNFTPKMLLAAQGLGEHQKQLNTTQQILNIEEPKNKFTELLKKYKFIFIAALSVIVIGIVLFLMLKSKKPEYHFILITNYTVSISKDKLVEFIKEKKPVDFEIHYKKVGEYIPIKNNDSIEGAIIEIIEQTPSDSILDFYVTSRGKKDTILAIIVYGDKYHKNIKTFIDSVMKQINRQSNNKNKNTTTDKPLILPVNTNKNIVSHKDSLKNKNTTKTDTNPKVKPNINNTPPSPNTGTNAENTTQNPPNTSPNKLPID